MASEESYPELISLAAHELRTPANVVWGYLRMLQGDSQAGFGERQRHMIDEAEKSCARLVELMAELSEIGKLDRGQMALARRAVDLFGLAAEAAGALREAEERGVRLDVRGASAGALIDGDPDRLRAAMSAVFRAILREQPRPCTIVADRTRTSSAGVNVAIIVVADTSRIQTAHDAAPDGAFNDKRGGLGLALPIARRVIEAHGGELQSRPAGGAVMRFPLAT